MKGIELSDIEKAAVRFWRKVDKRGPDECWPWIASIDGHDYGSFRINQKTITAHRCAFLLSGGALTEKKNCVMHTCDNRRCCNPAHLLAGSVQDNNHDKAKKGRSNYNSSKGEQSVHAKVTQSEVDRIRALYTTGMYTYTRLGEMYGLTKATICSIIKYRTWKGGSNA